MEGGYRRQWPLFWFSFALLIFVLLGVLYVALFGATLAFKDYQALHGMAGSPWAGYTNFSSLMGGQTFLALMGNGALLKLCELAAALVGGGVLAMLIACIPHGGVRAGVSAALLVPALAPAVLFAALLPETGNAYAYFLRSLVPCACFAAFTGGMIAALRNGGVVDALLGVALAGLLLAMRLLSPDLPTLLLAQNPLNYAWSDALISYSYRTGLIQTDYSGAAAAQALVSGAQLLLALPLAALFARILPARPTRLEARGALPAAALLSVLLIAIIALACGLEGALPLNSTGMILPLLAGLAGGVLMLALTGAPSRKWLAISAALVLSLGGNEMAEYLLARIFGWINTPWPIVLLSPLEPRVFSLLVVMALSAREQNRAWLCLAGALVTAAYAWGDFYLPMLYIMRVDQLNAGYMARQMVFSGENPLLGMAYCALPAAALSALAAMLHARLGVCEPANVK